MFKNNLVGYDEKPMFFAVLLLLVIICFYNWTIALLCLIAIVAVYLLTRKTVKERNKELNLYLDAMTQSIDQASNYALQNLPTGIAIVDIKSRVCWSNSVFRDWIGDLDENQRLQSIMPNFRSDKFWGKSGYFYEHIGAEYYRVVYKFLQTELEADNDYLILYLDDVTDSESRKVVCEAAMPVFCYLELDNMEEVSKGLTEAQRATLWADVNNCIIDEISVLEGFVKSYSDESYIACISKKTLEQLEKNNFTLLDKVRAIHTVNRIPVTLSMGIATSETNFNAQTDKARSGLDLALGRGGDQVAVYEGEEVKFFGGKTQAVEKNTRVRARVVSQAIRELINDSELVLIMGHEREDYDSIGAAMGMSHMAKIDGKRVHIVVSGSSSATEKLQEKVKKTPGFEGLLITPEEAESIADDRTLLFVVDVHRSDMVAAPGLLAKTSRRVVIDHHRRGSGCIVQPLLLYLEPSSSSSSELVTELLQYYVEKVELEKVEATALYAGIIVDTKNFAIQTGVRTFDAAAYLRRSGADPQVVRDLFSVDFATVRLKAQVLAETEQLSNGLAITCCPADVQNAQIVAAQIADMLVNIENITAGFALFNLPDDGGIGVSARSQGEVNVQLIMEELGGGGHRTVAGAQLRDKTMEEARAAVIAAANKVLKNGD